MSNTPRNCPQCGVELSSDHTAALCPKCLLQVGFETQDGPLSSSTNSAYAPTFVAPTPEELAPHFPQLEILEVVGFGGMGVVYKARQTNLDRIVALKIIRPGVSGDELFSERFQREAKALAKLNHPNIITVHDFGRKDELFYFVMEYVEGANLRHLQRTATLTPQQALEVVPKICAALQYAHDNGVVHRDIKPENILISTAGEVRIADFGLAKLAGTVDSRPLTGTWQVMGTPHYMAPEQFEKPTTVDHRADIYSLGVVIYELLTGELPLGRFPLPSEKAQLDTRLDEVVLRSLDKEPDRRYQQATDVASAVEEVSSDNASGADFGSESANSAFAVAERKAREMLTWLGTKSADLSRKFTQKSQDTVRKWRVSGYREERFRGLVGWFHNRRNLIGAAIMLLAALGTVLLPWFGTQQPVPNFIAAAIGIFLVFFGRGLRRDQVPPWIGWTAAACLVPAFLLPNFINILVVIFLTGGLLSLLQKSDTNESDTPPEPDVVDHIARGLKNAGGMFSGRLLLLTFSGIMGWILIVAASAFAVFWLWLYPMAPSEYIVEDTTAVGLKPRSGDYEVSITFPDAEESFGLDPSKIQPLRNRMTVTARSGNRSAVLRLNKYGKWELRQGSTILQQGMVPSSETLLSFLACVSEDATSHEVVAQAIHLSAVIRAITSSYGLEVSMNSRLAKRYPSLSGPIDSILRERNDHEGRPAPVAVGRLIDRKLFFVDTEGRGVRVRVRPQEWVTIACLAIPGFIFVTGLLRILRILYIYLWKPASLGAAVTQDSIRLMRATWASCCARIIIAVPTLFLLYAVLYLSLIHI